MRDPLRTIADELVQRPRSGAAASDTQTWRRRLRDLMGDLTLVATPSGPDDWDVDVLLPYSGGTLALAWSPDDGTPWMVDYAAHWADGIVCVVGNQWVTVQDVLLGLRTRGSYDAALLSNIAELCVLGHLVAEREVQPSDEDLRAARAAWARRADEMARLGVSESRIDALIWNEASVASLRRVVLAELGTTNRSKVSMTDAWWARLPASTVLTGIADLPPSAASEQAQELCRGVAGAEYVSTCRARVRLPALLRTTDAGRTVARANDTIAACGAILSEWPAEDADGDDVFAEWLQAQVAVAEIRWHWDRA